eukprot:CAMPEP_0170502782 /NCGR_PEP_ID=MMETSP0208-20121228/42548_1 /TAXON_ID=197538 /ORGANISM="Strombidium inclinatum, Strain S3" /LENGTH=70 /DNA_ID=CAMNT_0010782055 /DNA_START=227 /DNA_END=439 /DNA_ORIENTATION=+
MKKVYKFLKEAYRIQSGYGPSGVVFSIGLNQTGIFLSEIVKAFDEADTGGFKSTDADILFITVKAGKRGP